jgi:hypothetical protein
MHCSVSFYNFCHKCNLGPLLYDVVKEMRFAFMNFKLKTFQNKYEVTTTVSHLMGLVVAPNKEGITYLVDCEVKGGQGQVPCDHQGLARACDFLRNPHTSLF